MYEFQVLPLREASMVDECRGLWFRGYSNIFYSDGRFEKKQGIRLLKRRSCKGCYKCHLLLHNAREMMSYGNLIFPDEIKDGGLYTIQVTNIHKDWESGYVDDWDIEIVEVNE